MCIPSCHLTEAPDLSLNATLYHVVLPESSVQSARTYIFTAGLSRPLNGSERILSVALTGDGNFQIDSNTRVVTTSVPTLQAGRYTFDISILYLSPQPYTLTASGIVDVVSQCEYMFVYMSYCALSLLYFSFSIVILQLMLFCSEETCSVPFVYACTHAEHDSRGISHPLSLSKCGSMYVSSGNIVHDQIKSVT